MRVHALYNENSVCAGVAGGGALALLLAGLACLLYARTRRKMLWSEMSARNGFGPHQSGAHPSFCYTQ